MADIEITRPHNLGLKGARRQAEHVADHLGRKFDLKGDWDGNVLRFERPGVSGSLAIGEKDLKLAVTLGFLLKAMKGSIEKAVMHELDAQFAEAAPAKAAAKATPVSAKKAPAPKKKGD